MYVDPITKRDKKLSLKDIDTAAPKKVNKEEALKQQEKLEEELFMLQDLMFGAKKNSVLVVLQGRDTAGKDGTIKRVVGALNPRGVHVASFGVPTEEEREHDFLWRIHRHTPRLGEFSIFNRSHYEDVLVVRVHQLLPEKIWKERYDHINTFEETLAEHGCLILKFFLHISKDEQKDRLLEREADPSKAWKLNPNDWKERQYWGEYTEANEVAISRCSSEHAPWWVVPADAKWYRNLVVTEALVKTLRPYRESWVKALEREGKAAKAALEEYKKKEKAK
ncbi:MAG: polyphosphate kinase 2 family protein [Deltaproteobacteria bacterium]|nr:polyphosphate kinase 2 family protein [Deltaproteobacteria bacterium]